MATIFNAQHLVFLFGLLGNIVSFMVYLAPLPTFYRIFKKKSTQEFHSIPYSVALFSAMLMLFYGFLKPTNGFMLITINSVGCVIESLYLIVFLIYAPKTSKIQTAKLLFFFNLGLYGSIVASTLLLVDVLHRVMVVGWICAVFSVCVFAAPLSTLRMVIRTKSVEYMPLNLSVFLTLCAVMWFFYGILIKDLFIALPNVLGFSFGITQMILYVIYKDVNKKMMPEFKDLPNQIELKDAQLEKMPSTPNNNNNIITDIVIIIPENITSTVSVTSVSEKTTATEPGDLNNV